MAVLHDVFPSTSLSFQGNLRFQGADSGSSQLHLFLTQKLSGMCGVFHCPSKPQFFGFHSAFDVALAFAWINAATVILLVER